MAVPSGPLAASTAAGRATMDFVDAYAAFEPSYELDRSAISDLSASGPDQLATLLGEALR